MTWFMGKRLTLMIYLSEGSVAKHNKLCFSGLIVCVSTDFTRSPKHFFGPSGFTLV